MKCIKTLLIASLMITIASPLHALPSPTARLGALKNRLQKEVREFINCIRGKNCDPKRKKIYKTIAIITAIIATVIVSKAALHVYRKKKPVKNKTKKTQSQVKEKKEEKSRKPLTKDEQRELNSSLHDAIINQKTPEFIETLLQEGADIGDTIGTFNALHRAVWSHPNQYVVKLLLDWLKKNDETNFTTIINAKNFSDLTPLNLAVARRKNIEIIRLLLNAGADHSIGDKDNKTPLHKAARGNVAEVVELLLNAKADHTKKDNFDKTPLSYAKEGSEIKKLLLNAQKKQ